MKFKPEFYAKALAQAVQENKGEDAGKMAKNLVGIIERNGDTAEFPAIIEMAERFIREQNGDRKVTLTSARPLSGMAKSLVEGILKPGDTVEHAIDPSLIAGINVVIDDQLQFDGSLKSKLEKIFG